MTRLLLGSGGIRTEARREAWNASLDAFLGPAVTQILFVPHALQDHDMYVAKLLEKGLVAGRELIGIHTASDPIAAIQSAQCIFVGGGNTWRLADEMQQRGWYEPIRQRVESGMPYIGVSAGTNMACPTFRTTNDMPIVYPARDEALNLVPFQINAHYFAGPFRYFDADGETELEYAGETRDDRIREFHERNEMPVLGLWEGGILRVENGTYQLIGPSGARLFRRDQPHLDLSPPADLTPFLAAAR